MKVAILLLPLFIACSSPKTESTPVVIKEWTQGEERFKQLYPMSAPDSYYIPNDTNWFEDNPWFMDEKYAFYDYCFGEFGAGVVIRPLRNDSLLYEVQNMNCPVHIQTFKEGYLITGYTGHMRGHSSVLLLDNLTNLNSFTKQDFIDTLIVLGQGWNTIDTTSQFDYQSFLRWKHKQATWLMDTAGIQLLSAFPRNERELTVIYSSYYDSIGLFVGQLSLENDTMNRLLNVQKISNDPAHPRRVQTNTTTIHGTKAIYTSLETSNGPGLSYPVELINFGDSVIWRIVDPELKFIADIEKQ
ncbi:MAG: hypothetical protein HWD92_04955 [Flavobacteriia bacterium]|nr:hypothetical protein [Flavobacteriia bacterium]